MMSSRTSAALREKFTYIIYCLFPNLYLLSHTYFFLIWWEIIVAPTAAGSHRAFCKPPQVPVAMQNPTQWAARS